MTDVATSCLADLKFRKTADPKMVRAASAGDPAAFQHALTKSLSKSRKRFEKEFPETPFTSLWSEAIAVADADRELLALLDQVTDEAKASRKAREQHLRSLIANVANAFKVANLAPSPFASLVAAEVLLRHSEDCSPENACLLYCGLANLNMQDWACDPVPTTPAITDLLTQCVAQAEVPFTLSLILEAVSSSKDWRKEAAKRLASAIEDVTDTDGTLQAAVGRHATDWLASFVRVAGWSSAFRPEWASTKTMRRWQQALQRVVALMTPEGLITHANQPHHEFASRPDQSAIILQHGLRLAEVPGSSKLRSLVAELIERPGRSKSKTSSKSKSQKSKTSAERCSEQSDWAEFALLRNGLRIDADVMALDWDETNPNMHLAALGTNLLDGEWTSHITVNGERHETAGSWVCTCWFEDKEVAFAELESGSADGVRHVRQIMLSLDQHVAVITDSVTGPDDDADIEFTSQLPLSPETTAATDSITREISLKRGKVTAKTIPAWLEDDRVIQAMGTCDVLDGRLVMTAKNKGGVTLPLVLDWHPDRKHRDPDWSRLTVTEDRQVLTPRTASAYRVRVGNYQLLLYRSLRCGETLRAVLGYHTAHETVFGRVKRNGDIAPLVLVESETE